MIQQRQYMLDTNMASYIIKGTHPNVSSRLTQVPMDQLLISAVTEGELIYGLERKPNATALRRLVESFLQIVTVLPWDSVVARVYGTVRANLETQGTPMGNLDTMIGAHSLAVGAVVVTHDKAFRHIFGLQLEDWTV
ncbi:tRNA(fMet)-specific endonuclease VapC [Granulicella aggregans]|uniref:tRNA(fMet)-specific endonuclease VapC n=1 Tax=Granulicella aggregans TaxID=474949 RepID=A0A7W7ZKP0_9BACT|nr:tRNA(fMet)-specific endonuclease VapC [Granulicella aggregans]